MSLLLLHQPAVVGGPATVTGAADHTVTVGLDAAGRNTARGAVDTTVIVSLDAAGRNTAKGALDTTVLVDLAVAGTVIGAVVPARTRTLMGVGQ